MKNIVNLGNVATYINGYAFKPSDWAEDGTPIIRIQDLTGNSYQMNRFKGIVDSKYDVNSGDVLISWSASLGVYVWNRGNAVLNQHIFKVVFDKEEVDKDFFVFQIDNLLKRAANQAHGATMRHLTKPVFDALPFYLPDIKTQRLISSKLNLIVHLIEDHHEQLKKLDELIRSRFLEMFGEPWVNDKEFPCYSVGQVAESVTYGTSAPASDSGQYEYLRMNNLTDNGQLDLSDLKRIDMSDEQAEKYMVKKGDILFNRTNSIDLVGKTALFNLNNPMIIAGYLIRIRLSDKVNPVYFVAYMNMPYMKEKLRNIAKGAVNQANINSKELKSIQILIPPLSLQNEYCNFVLSIDKSVLLKLFSMVPVSVLHMKTEHIRSYLSAYADRTKCSKSNLDNIRRILSSFFTWLEEESYILKNPVRRIHKIKVDKTVKETYSDEAMERMRDECHCLRDLAIIDLLASSGMRVGELVRLNREDIDFDNRECIVFGKGSKERPVYFDARTKIHLKNYLDSRTDDNPALFVSLLRPYNRLQISGVEIRLRSLGRELGIPKVHPHKFRRTLATRAIDKGMPIEQVQRLLGHTQIDTTMQYAMINQKNVKVSHQKYIA